MTDAVCFDCKGYLPEMKQTMEDLIKIGLPMFCSVSCSMRFPNNGTKEFELTIDKLAREYGVAL